MQTDWPTKPCFDESFRISSALPKPVVMKRKPTVFKPLLAALFITLVQIFVAVVLLAPEGPFAFRYQTLIQHDSHWFANIVDRGYETTVPPISHKMMEVSNVAFFPAYPALSAVLRYGFHLSTPNALLITAQIAAWGFWSYFFFFCHRWNIPPVLQFFGALAILAHPGAFFLVAGYSESLFMMGLFGFMYWSSGEGSLAKFLAVLHGFTMSAARIVGLLCTAFPVVNAIFKNGWSGLRDVRSWMRRYRPSFVVMAAAALGAGSFFFYCLWRWGRWDIYLLTQQAGWAIFPDYLAVFRPESFRWLVPALKNPTEASQMAMTLGAVLLVAVVLCELLPAVRRNASWRTRIGFYFCGAIIYYISVSGVASVEMESMLRYEFCLHALIVLAFVHFLHQLRTPPLLVRVGAMAAIALLSAAGLGVQGWYVWNFTRGNWVA
ncbi:MAG TPA: hypothetical protein VK581_15000 [Chthoniobacterales bacterium]|nr:hypothetical protein [Chthoniobacterales bacterium]